jgi:hypothetical protein
MIDRLLLGDNPFNSVDHLSQERARKRPGLTTEEIAGVVQAAFESGASGFVFSNRPKNLLVLSHLKAIGSPREMKLYPVVPDVQEISQQVSTEGTLALLRSMLSQMNLTSKAKLVFRGGLGAMTRDPIRLLRAYLAAEVSAVRKAAPSDATLVTLMLHELFTDLIVALRLEDFLEEYVGFVRDGVKTRPGFVTRNFSQFTEFARQTRIELDDTVVMTPLNAMGYQMNPNRDACEESLKHSEGLNVIGMSVLSAGFLTPGKAIEYLNSLPKRVSCVVGVSTVEHAHQTFAEFKRRLE